jgi:hypothetical protein
MQDEAESEEDCVCGEDQHERAKAVFAAIKSLDKVLSHSPAPSASALDIRNQALEEAALACEAERVEMTGTDGDAAYNMAITHCTKAIREKKVARIDRASTAGAESGGKGGEDDLRAAAVKPPLFDKDPTNVQF